MSDVSQQVRREVVQAVARRYRGADRSERKRILDELVKLTGYHRKHAIRVQGAASGAKASGTTSGARTRIYDEAVQAALVVLWEASDRICGKGSSRCCRS